MKIKTKILLILPGMSLLVALVGALAVNRQRASAKVAATEEAEHAARVLTILMSDQTEPLVIIQKIIPRLHRSQGRNVVLVDSQTQCSARREGMGESLTTYSAGAGKGAAFSHELPCKPGEPGS